jgi:hypothetical protein
MYIYIDYHNYFIHFLGKEMDSKTVIITVPVNSLEAFLILVAFEG